MRIMRWAAVLGAALLAGCSAEQVAWSDPQAAPGDTLGRLAIAGGMVGFAPVDSAAAPEDSMMCPATVASASAGGVRYAAWMHRRPDSTVAVVAARFENGRWSAPATVDSVDAGRFGCNRPGPSIAVSSDGYVHISYSLRAPEGFGVFFAHSMDRGATFHSPMIIVYGDRLSATATAANGSHVAVAYEEASGAARRIDLALSNTQGHTFEPRIEATPDAIPATRPRVALADTLVAISFAGPDGTDRALRIGRLNTRQ